MASQNSQKATKLFRSKDALQSARETYECGNPIGLLEAVALLDGSRSDYPEWVVRGIKLALAHYVTTFKYAKYTLGPKFKQNKKDHDDYRSFRAVKSASASGYKGEAKFDEAARLLLDNWKIKREIDTVVKAYKAVSKALKTREGRARYSRYSSPVRPILSSLLP